jgi:hypothetical protein
MSYYNLPINLSPFVIKIVTSSNNPLAKRKSVSLIPLEFERTYANFYSQVVYTQNEFFNHGLIKEIIEYINQNAIFNENDD